MNTKGPLIRAAPSSREKEDMPIQLPPVDRYTYRTVWSHEDQQFVATVAEFPSLSWLAATPESAEAGLKAVVIETQIDLAESGGVIPVPQPQAVPWPQYHTPAPSPMQMQPPPSFYPTFQMPQVATAPAQGVQQSVNVVVGGGYGYRPRGIGVAWHLIHGSLTALSCGLWGVVWIAHIVIDAQQKRR